MKKQIKERILFLDIENFQYLDKIFKYGAGFNADEGAILSFQYKWKGEKDVYVIHNNKKQVQKDLYNDRGIVDEAYKVLSKADKIVVHYGKEGSRKFGGGHDKPYLNTKLLLAGYPYLDIPVIDTCSLARTKLRFSNNRLSTLAIALKCKHKKLDVPHSLWPKAACGDYNALKQIADYGMGDVLCLEDVYHKLEHLIPIVNAKKASENYTRCPTCGSNKLAKDGISRRRGYVRQKYRCTFRKCGRIFSGEIIK